MMLHAIARTAALLAALVAASAAPAADFAALDPYLTADVSSVVYLELPRLNLPALLAEMERLNFVPEDELSAAKQHAAGLQSGYDGLLQLGARRACVLIRASDFLQGGPMLVVETAEPAQAQPVADWLAAHAAVAAAAGDFADYLPKVFEVRGKTVVGAASRERIKTLLAGRGTAPRQDALDALAAAGDADLAWVAFGDDDSRRVVREMFPALPPPFMEIDGKLLADHLRWIGVALKLPPEPTIGVSLLASDAESTALLENAANKALALAKGLLVAELASDNETHRTRAKELLPVLAMLQPRVEGTRLSIAFGDDDAETKFLRDYLPQVVAGARTAASRDVRINRFKQITLGMLNHESARRALPASASYSPDGKPLLSWRVLILPYMEQMELYRQFHLDEPWDSEHNLALVERMPDVYADPDPAIRAAAGPGRTTFLAPTGPKLLFGGQQGAALSGVKDGTSNTVLVVEVVPQRAVPWTKPDDWQVDAADPLAGVKRTDRDLFSAGFCDGSVRTFPNDTDPKAFHAMLTPASGDVINAAGK